MVIERMADPGAVIPVKSFPGSWLCAGAGRELRASLRELRLSAFLPKRQKKSTPKPVLWDESWLSSFLWLVLIRNDSELIH